MIPTPDAFGPNHVRTVTRLTDEQRKPRTRGEGIILMVWMFDVTSNTERVFEMVFRSILSYRHRLDRFNGVDSGDMSQLLDCF